MSDADDRASEPVYVQAIPLFLASDAAASKYFKDNLAELDALTGPHIMVVMPEEVDAGNAAGVLSAVAPLGGADQRFPGLQRRDLPCLWIEDSLGGKAILKLPRDNDDMAALLRAMGDACAITKQAAAIRRQALSNFKDGQRARPSAIALLIGDGLVTKSTERLIALGFGVAFVLAILVIALFIPNPTPFQYTIFRIVLALAAAGFVSMTPGFIEAKVGTGVRAGGALAVFVVVYFFAPAAIDVVAGNHHAGSPV